MCTWKCMIAEENEIFLFILLVTVQSFKETVECSVISYTVSLIFKNPSKSVSSMYVYDDLWQFKIINVEMWLLKGGNIWLFRLWVNSDMNLLNACLMIVF